MKRRRKRMGQQLCTHFGVLRHESDRVAKESKPKRAVKQNKTKEREKEKDGGRLKRKKCIPPACTYTFGRATEMCRFAMAISFPSFHLWYQQKGKLPSLSMRISGIHSFLKLFWLEGRYTLGVLARICMCLKWIVLIYFSLTILSTISVFF